MVSCCSPEFLMAGFRWRKAIEAITSYIVIQKHKMFGFNRLSTMVLARALTDIPLLPVQCLLSSILM